MQENFSQAINMLQATDTNSESLPSTQQANNLSTTTVTNAQLPTFLKTLQNKVDNTANPRTGKPFKRYCFSCGYCQHWGKIVRQKNRDIKMMRPLRTEWVAVMITICPIVRDWGGSRLTN